MSIWADIQARSAGITKRKEDEFVEEENLWNFGEVLSGVTPGPENWTDLSKSIKKLKNEQIKLGTKITDLRREIDKFRWHKCKTKCNYII
jgi:hypothetical protein